VPQLLLAYAMALGTAPATVPRPAWTVRPAVPAGRVTGADVGASAPVPSEARAGEL